MLGNWLPEFPKEEARQLKGSLLQHNIYSKKNYSGHGRCSSTPN
ncbi:hypothetical protein glysoja_043434 [Glycine soja]|uniref:Uncharacterized protein n=1 Tax=Glycine soja TaxID=3848 RepID=A0A0B2RS93_GLYSO|nr:hypothetical protein glysoja_043434 [Glycine soja]